MLAPSCYKKDTIYAIEEQDDNNSDIDLELGMQPNKKKKKRKKRQDFRNKLEDWQTCEVSLFFLRFSLFISEQYQRIAINSEIIFGHT